MSYDWFHAVADRLTEPLLLVSGRCQVLASNRGARRALGQDLDGSDLCARAAQPERLRRYLTLAGRSTNPMPGSMTLFNSEVRWRCDASLTVMGSTRALLLQLRSTSESSRRFVALNEQIDLLHAEIRRRSALEREREALLVSEQQARAAAEEANRLKDEFLASISHELRTPLQNITGWLSLIRRKPGSPEQLARGLEVIERNVKSQLRLTEDLVDVSMAITGRMKLDLEPVDLEVIVRQAVDSALPAAEAKQQRIEVVADTGGCVINGDPSRLLQIVWNLLSNATRYTPKEGKIQVVLRRINSHAEISVSDTGAGIAPEVLPYIFDRFRRADASTTRRHGGLGLGLSIVRHLVELHGGFVLADSDGQGQGTTFTVHLPLPIYQPRGAALTDVPRRGVVEAAGPLAGLRVLLVEDHEDSRELLSTLLTIEGAEVKAVGCSAQAQAVFRERATHFDIVISDIEMPEEDGFTLMRKLRDLERELGRKPVPAIAVSAHTIGSARLHALRAGYHTFLAKPIQPEELITMVANLSAGRPDGA